jgi:ATP-dependent DNA helicase RecG
MSTLMRYTDAELEKMLDELESDLVERKESWRGDDPEKGRQTVCASGRSFGGSTRSTEN